MLHQSRSFYFDYGNIPVFTDQQIIASLQSVPEENVFNPDTGISRFNEEQFISLLRTDPSITKLTNPYDLIRLKTGEADHNREKLNIFIGRA